MSALDLEIESVKAALVRHHKAADARREAIDADGGPQSAHEHDDDWNRHVDKLERAGAWLCVLLRKRGGSEDEALALNIERDVWP